ncbi:MAG: hypothetical protein HOV81_24180 [Kofleriaceae bacterium]|nr:hypothetical protein [Kofleriaceae bacterium]
MAHADTAIHSVGIEVAPTKASGDKWDRGLGEEPDPAIEVRLDGKTIATCPTKKDTLKADCAVADHRFVGPVAIELRVDDADLVNNDPVGTARGQIPYDWTGTFALSVDGQVAKAWVEVIHVEGPGFWSTFTAKIGARGLGAILGILLALLLYRQLGAAFLTPSAPRRKSDEPSTRRERPTGAGEPRARDDEPDGIDADGVRFWRSPILLTSAGASIFGMVLANLLRAPGTHLALACIPYVLGGFAMTAPIIDAYKVEHLGQKRLRLVLAGVVTMLAVPLFDLVSNLFTGISFIAGHIGWFYVLVIVLACLL